jgi:hypothetical protein
MSSEEPMFVNFSALVIAGVVVIAAISQVWLLREQPSGSATEDPQH